ncbi:unnamed protein product [Musa textilis]
MISMLVILQGPLIRIDQPSEVTTVELDDLCYELGWTLPQYSVLPSILDGRVEDVNFYSGMFQATVTLKGLNFECTVNGDMKSSRRAARSSAAATHMLSKLLSMARSQAQARV